MNSVIRTITPDVGLPADATAPEVKPEVKGEVPTTSFNEGGDNLVLSALGVTDEIGNLPEESKENIAEVEEFVGELMKKNKLKTTSQAFTDTFKKVMDDMDIDPNTEPMAALDRIGGVIKGWKNLAFISDPAEKRSLFMKLAKLPDSKAMNKFVFSEMNRKEVYA